MSFRLIDPFREKKELTEREQEAMKSLVKFHRESRKEFLLTKLNSADYRWDKSDKYCESNQYFSEMNSTRDALDILHTGSRTVRDYEKDRILKIKSDYLKSKSRNKEIIEFKKSPISVKKCSNSGNIYLSNR